MHRNQSHSTQQTDQIPMTFRRWGQKVLLLAISRSSDKVIASRSVVTMIGTFPYPSRSIKRNHVKAEINNNIVKKTKTRCTSEGVSLFIDPFISHINTAAHLSSKLLIVPLSYGPCYFHCYGPCYFHCYGPCYFHCYDP